MKLKPGETVEEAVDKMKDFVASLDKVLDEFLDAARENGIIFITAAGNSGYRVNPTTGLLELVVAQGDQQPTNRGGRDSDIIVVGGATKDGTLWPVTAPPGVHIEGALVQDENDPRIAANGNPRLGWTDVYAPAVGVPTCTNIDGQTAELDGTSLATAQVVSLPS